MHKTQMYENLRDMLEREVTEIEKKGELNESSLDHLYKLMTAIKVADKCIEREKEKEQGSSFGYGYSRSPYSNAYDSYGNGSYGSYNSYARRGRDGDSDGRYNESRESRDNFRYSQDRGRSYESYAYGNSRDAKKEMVERLSMLMENAGNEQERNAIMDCIDRIK